MPYLIGILLDVSTSMKYVFEGFGEKEEKRSRSVFSLVNDVVDKDYVSRDKYLVDEDDVSLDNEFVDKYYVPRGNDVFAIGYGARNSSSLFDILGSFVNFQETYDKTNDKPIDEIAYKQMFDLIFVYIRAENIISFQDFKANVPFHTTKFLYDALRYSKDLREQLMYLDQPFRLWMSRWVPFYNILQNTERVKKIKATILKEETVIDILLRNNIQTFSFAKAIQILRYWLEGRKLDDGRIRSIMQNAEPFLYGDSDLVETLKRSMEIFVQGKYVIHKKYLIVLSTGGLSDADRVSEQIKEAKINMRDRHVKLICCYISKSQGTDILHNRTLFSSEKKEWDASVRELFHLSSGIATQLLPRQILHARGWNIETENDTVKLFLQVNHPDHIQEACNLVKEVVCSQDALLSIIGNISLVKYIKKTNDAFTAQKQVGGTCYANAAAAVLHLAMKRVLNRKDGYPDFDDIRKILIDKYGKDGASTIAVLTDMCKPYRLQCKTVNADLAIDAISSGRPLVATFRLTDSEWVCFQKFFKTNPKGVLTKKYLDIDKRNPDLQLIGHAVVLTSSNSQCFRFMNSWGGDWGDMGFFRVENNEVLDMQFVDVFWSMMNLFPQEISYFNKHGASVAKKLIHRFSGLAEKSYTCPNCFSESRVRDFTGTLSDACCPKCMQTFECSNDIAMNLYLSSILYKQSERD